MYKNQNCVGDTSDDDDDVELIAEVGYIASRLRFIERTLWSCLQSTIELSKRETATNESKNGTNEHAGIDANWIQNYIRSIKHYDDEDDDDDDDDDDNDNDNDNDNVNVNVNDNNDKGGDDSEGDKNKIVFGKAIEQSPPTDNQRNHSDDESGRTLNLISNSLLNRDIKKSDNKTIINKLNRKAAKKQRRKLIEDLLIQFYEDYEKRTRRSGQLLQTQNCGIMNENNIGKVISTDSKSENHVSSTNDTTPATPGISHVSVSSSSNESDSTTTTTTTTTATAATSDTTVFQQSVDEVQQAREESNITTSQLSSSQKRHGSNGAVYSIEYSTSQIAPPTDNSSGQTISIASVTVSNESKTPSGIGATTPQLVTAPISNDPQTSEGGGLDSRKSSPSHVDLKSPELGLSYCLHPGRKSSSDTKSLPDSRVDVVSSTVVATTLAKARSALFATIASTTPSATAGTSQNLHTSNNNNTPSVSDRVNFGGDNISDLNIIESGSDDGAAVRITTVTTATTTTTNGDYTLCKFKEIIKQCQFNENDLRAVIRDLKRKIEYTERMNWLCLSKRPMEPLRRKSSLPKHSEVKKKFLEICDNTLSEEVKAALRLPAFDSYDWEDADVIYLMQTMFMELGLIEKFNIPIGTLREWLYEVYKHYNEVPFHNFRHCFCVAQMMYVIARQANLISRLGELEVLILLVSCICHDLDHPGYNNIYQINARTELALRYNDISPLENHHCSIAFRLLEHPDCNIFKNFNRETFNEIREGIIRCILATDMARHNEILTQFKEIVQNFDYTNRAHVNLLCMVLIKVADISNETRPMDVAEPWLDRLFQEFFAQSAAEKSEGLPVTPFMDPDKVSKPGSQVRFIGLVLLPLFEALGELLPELTEIIIMPVRVAFDYYKHLNDVQMKSRRSLAEAAENSSDGGTGSGGGSVSEKTVGGSSSPQLPRSQSGISVRSRRSIPSQKSASRTSVDEPTCVAVELHDLPEGSESGDSETATEVDVAEKTSKFKVDTEGSNRSKSSHSTSRKSSREKRPSMISEMCSSGGRMRNSYGNIHGYHTNRCHFGSNRAVSLDQYSCNNRRLSDGLQQVISDSNVFYNRHNRSLDNEVQPNSNNLNDKPKKIDGTYSVEDDALNMNISGTSYEGIIGVTGGHSRHHQKGHFIHSSTGKMGGTTTNGNTGTNLGTDPSSCMVGSASQTPQNGTKTWKDRFKQITELFTFGFDRRNKRLTHTTSARTTPSSMRNNNLTETHKPGMRYTISNNLTLSMKQKQKLMEAGRNSAYSLDVPARNRYSSSSGGDSRKSSRNDDNSNRHDPLTEDNNSNHTSSGDMPIASTMKPTPKGQVGGGGGSVGGDNDYGAGSDGSDYQVSKAAYSIGCGKISAITTTTTTPASVLYITLDGTTATTNTTSTILAGKLPACTISQSKSTPLGITTTTTTTAAATTTTTKPLKISGGCSSYSSGTGFDESGLYGVPESGPINEFTPAVPPDISEHKI